MLSVGGLFSGIGGWELGLERAGMRVLWHCEADPYARAVLERHWPGVPCYPDVRELRGADVEPVDVLCGGFPCQDISVAGRGAGITGERSSLWSEMLRLTDELGPRYLLVENVSALIARGLDVVLAGLAEIGFDAEWGCLRASDFGAPHRRERIWLVAYPGGQRGAVGREAGNVARASRTDQGQGHQRKRHGDAADDRCADVADASGIRRWEGPRQFGRLGPAECSQRPPLAYAGGAGLEGAGDGRATPDRAREVDPWLVEPDVGRVAHGVPARVDRLRCLGNALVPQISEWIGRRVIAYEHAAAGETGVA